MGANYDAARIPDLVPWRHRVRRHRGSERLPGAVAPPDGWRGARGGGSAPDAAPTQLAAEQPAANPPPSAAPSTPYNIGDATPPPHPQVAKPGAGRSAQWVKPVERRAATAAARPVAPVRPAPPSVQVYAQVPAPAGTYYVYPGYPAYRPGYVPYRPRYYYYRVY